MENITEVARKAVAEAARQMQSRSLTVGTWGNLSARAGADCYAITPSGRAYSTLTSADIALVNGDGMQLGGDYLPSSELPLHLAIYRSLPQAQAIAHTHSTYAGALAAARQPLPPVMEDVAQIIGGTVRVAAYAAPGTELLAAHALAALQNQKAALLANHGVVTWGADLAEALLVAEIVEKAAQIYYLSRAFGGAVVLTDDEVRTLHEFYEQHYRRRQRGAAEDE
jgi:L-fuculose-phosphate aldolase